MKSKSVILAVTFAVMAFASQPVFATTIDAQWNGWGGADFGGNRVGYGSGSVWPNPSYPTYPSSTRNLVGVGLGGDNFFTSDKSYGFSSTGYFNTWCVDITHWMSGNQVTYNVDGVAELALAFGASGAARVADLNKLANEFYPLVQTTETSAAFQQATWAVMFGTKDTSGKYNLDNETFYAPYGNTGHDTAATWLSDLGAVGDRGKFNITYLNDGTANNTQDMVVFTPAPVPEPGTLSLLGIGGMLLFGLGWTRRSKAKE